MSWPAAETLAFEREGQHVLVVRLNRPDVLNAISTQMGHDLLALWTRLTVSPDDVRCVVLTGSGDRAFCAGGDLKERRGMTNETWRAQHELFERGFMALSDCPVPVIAAVNGAAYGGGLETALGCDFIYASSTARFALSEVSLGIMPGGGGTQTLTAAVGARRAKELIFAAQPFSADDALRWGMVNRVCEPTSLLPEALALATRICDNAPLSVRQVKKSIRYGTEMPLASGYRYEIEAYNALVGTDDRHEGVLAFNEKRKPRFVGR